MRIVVIGGTGLIGSKLVKILGDHGHEAVAAAPSTGVDTLTGAGLAEVLKGAQVVVDVSNSASFDRETAMKFFAPGIADTATVDGKVRVPPVLFQPIAGDDVARAVARTAVGPPLNGRIEIAGPTRYRMEEFFRKALAAWGDSREVVAVPLARYSGRVLNERSLVPGEGAQLGTITYRDWLGQSTEKEKGRTMDDPGSNAAKSPLTLLQDVEPPFVPAGAHAMTVIIEYPPGSPGSPAHRHPGPAFGLVLEGELLLELEGEPERVVRAGEAFWEPGGDLIHYQDGNNRDDVPVRFTVTMLCTPGEPMTTMVDEAELAERKDRRAPRPS
jgi:uncharacterized protein YbjT (DUF2867 family)/quercetin dioxygenase-like cupin family protein